jgi:hypothetical protein
MQKTEFGLLSGNTYNGTYQNSVPVTMVEHEGIFKSRVYIFSFRLFTPSEALKVCR